jgi:hypothetical protein
MAWGLDGIRTSLPAANTKVGLPATAALPAGVCGHAMPRR